MKDIIDLLSWIWSLVALVVHYIYETIKLIIIITVSLYTDTYQYMMHSPSFQNIPYLGKVMISGFIAGIVPLIAIGILQAFISAVIRGHIQESGLDRIIGSSPSTTSSIGGPKTVNQTQSELALRPYVTYTDPSVRVSRLRKGPGNSWTAEIRKGNNSRIINIGQPTFRGTLRINTFGSDGTVEWGN